MGNRLMSMPRTGAPRSFTDTAVIIWCQFCTRSNCFSALRCTPIVDTMLMLLPCMQCTILNHDKSLGLMTILQNASRSSSLTSANCLCRCCTLRTGAQPCCRKSCLAMITHSPLMTMAMPLSLLSDTSSQDLRYECLSASSLPENIPLQPSIEC